MRIKPIILLVSLAAAFLPASCSHRGVTGGDYGTVTPEQLQGRHHVFATGTSGASFEWKFKADRFTISRDNAALPGDVVTACLGSGKEAKMIEGRWTLDSEALILSDITADGKDGFKRISLHPFRTPVLRVDLNGTQYVFRQSP